MLSDNTDCSYENDDQHLQGLATQFVSSVDLLLCARDDKLMFGFPVHRVIMLAHSPVLSNLSEDLPELDHRESRQQTMPRVPMTDDSCTAIRAALSCIYGSYPSSEGVSRAGSVSAALPLQKAAAQAQNMILPHKYGMTKVLACQEEALIPVLKQALNTTIYSDTSCDAHFNPIVDCAAVAEHCGSVVLSRS